MSAWTLALAALLQFGQTTTGELHLTVADPTGKGVAALVEVVNEAQQFRATFETTQGTLIAKRLAFGTYRVHRHG